MDGMHCWAPVRVSASHGARQCVVVVADSPTHTFRCALHRIHYYVEYRRTERYSEQIFRLPVARNSGDVSSETRNYLFASGNSNKKNSYIDTQQHTWHSIHNALPHRHAFDGWMLSAARQPPNRRERMETKRRERIEQPHIVRILRFQRSVTNTKVYISLIPISS